jgi:hypothetical protein
LIPKILFDTPVQGLRGVDRLDARKLAGSFAARLVAIVASEAA